MQDIATTAASGRFAPGAVLTAASGAAFVVHRFVGREPGGELYLGREASGERTVAIHMLDERWGRGAAASAIRAAIEAGFERSGKVRHGRLLETVARLSWGTDALHGVVTVHCDGPLLGEYVAEYGALPLDVVLPLFVDLVDALQALHAAGVSHGALYPGHVRVELEADRMRPRLTGLHVAPLVGLVGELDEALAAYRPPVVASTTRGALLDDLYAVGALLVYCLTGAEPGSAEAAAILAERTDVPAEVAGLVTQCMQDDAGLRFQSLVAVRNVLGTLLEELEEASRRSPERPSPGDVIAGQYVVERLLGEGGMARVYLARDKVLGVQVAVKLLNATCASEPQVVERFLQEASIQARLVHPEPHPNIVAVHRVLHEAPVGYVMEYIEGCSLEELLSRESLTERQLIDIYAQVTDGLEHAHEHRIVHRDLKPSNILVSREADGRWLAKLMDFGISKQLDQPRTRTNLVLGTLGYIAPELFISARDASVASDLYALGCCIFESFVGDVPFPVTGGLRQLAFRVYNEPPPLPSSLGAPMSPELEALILLMLAKQPAERPASAAWVRDRLRAILAAAPDEALAVVVERHLAVTGSTLPAASRATTTGGTSRAMTTGRSARASLGPSPAEAAAQQRPRRLVIALLAALLAALVVGTVLFLLFGGDADEPGPTREAQAEVPTTQPATVAPPPEPVHEAEAVELPASAGRVADSYILGAAELLAEARALEAAGDKRGALALYEKAAAKLDQDDRIDRESRRATLVEMARLYEEVAAELPEATDDGAAPAAAAATLGLERGQLLASASVAYGRAADMTRELKLFLKKAELDQERGDASGALEALRDASEVTEDDTTREALLARIERIERAYEEGGNDDAPLASEDDEHAADAEDDDASGRRRERRARFRPLPEDQIEVWIESTPERAMVYLGGRRLGRTPLIKRLPKSEAQLGFVLKSKGRYDEKLSVDGMRGGKFNVSMSFKPRRIQ